MLPELSSVVLVRDVPPRRKGEKAVIINAFPQAKAYILEFETADEDGECCLICKADAVEAA